MSDALQAGWAGTEMARDVRFAERRRRGSRGEEGGETARMVPKERVEFIGRDVRGGKWWRDGRRKKRIKRRIRERKRVERWRRGIVGSWYECAYVMERSRTGV
jgi:hypothetical protein